MALSVAYVVEVVPLGVAALDQPDLPGAGPFLERLFALNCVGDFLVRLIVHEADDPVNLDEAGADALVMIVDPRAMSLVTPI